ncbi:MAG: tol-pal system-associated acyl-CoA thioesterase [Betaproteobacteria bacterium]|nr:tol-pal system-associated acyl-CoA thioesterase [Betaproteobacteria bacterium]
MIGDAEESWRAANFRLGIRVYYEDTDAGRVVYYANYLKFMERARTEWLRAMGLEQTALVRDHGIVFVVRSARVDYLRPARFNDWLQVSVEPTELGGSRMAFAQQVRRPREGQEDELLARAEVTIACVQAEAFRPVKIPEAVRATIARSRLP